MFYDLQQVFLRPAMLKNSKEIAHGSHGQTGYFLDFAVEIQEIRFPAQRV
jgi:hypothetical protein